MKALAIICFALAGLTGVAAIAQVIGLVVAIQKPESTMTWEVLLPQSVGGLSVPMVLLIVGLVLRKKAKTPPPLPR